MATYNGSNGIQQLREKIKKKGKLLVGESVEKLAITLVDNSPLGVEHYNSSQGVINNDVGDYKNSWTVGIGSPDPSTRAADAAGTGAVADAMIKSKLYNFEDKVYITNNVDHASQVEHGWEERPDYGWKAKDGYHVVAGTVGTANAILQAVANKVSLL